MYVSGGIGENTQCQMMLYTSLSSFNLIMKKQTHARGFMLLTRPEKAPKELLWQTQILTDRYVFYII